MSTIFKVIKVHHHEKGAFIMGDDCIYADNFIVAYKINGRWVLDLSKREKLYPEYWGTFDLLKEWFNSIETFENR
jgi:hypothetical protein